MSTSTLRVHINQIDYTLISPGPLDHSSLPRVPVIRIYGDSSLSQKACVHIHQVYPYFFVEYSGRMDPDDVNLYIARLTHSLNHAIALSLKRNPHSPNARFIRAILLVKGVNFYGFHCSYSPFLKILVANPSFISRTVTIMQSGTIMQTRFRVFESHLSYILQFMSDFGLYGCGWIDLGETWQRGKEANDSVSVAEDEYILDGANHRPVNNFLLSSPYFRQTRMALEVDAAAHQILNRHLIAPRHLHHKLEIPAPSLPSEPLVLSVRELWDDERRRRTAKGLNPSPEIPVDLSSRSRGPGAEWSAEAKWWEDIKKKIEQERETDLTTVENPHDWERWVMTTFESVEALWESQWKVWRPKKDVNSVTGGRRESDIFEDGDNPFGSAGGSSSEFDDNLDNIGEAEVDTSMLSSQAMSQLVEQEEAEWAKLMGLRERPDFDDYEDVDADEESLPEEDPLSDLEEENLSHPEDDHSPESLSNPFLDNADVQDNLVANADLALTGLPDVFSTDNAEPVMPTKSRKRKLQTNISSSSSQVYRVTQASEAQPGKHFETDGHSLGANSAAFPPDTETRPTKRTRISDSHTSGEASSIMSLQPLLPFDVTVSRPTVFTRITHSLFKCQARNANAHVYATAPPSLSDLLCTIDDHNIPHKVYREAHYHNKNNAPERGREIAGLIYSLKGGDGLSTIESWDSGSEASRTASELGGRYLRLNASGIFGWEFASFPPSRKATKTWLQSNPNDSSRRSQHSRDKSQMEGPTLRNIYGLKDTPAARPDDSSARERQGMSVLSLEVFAPSQGNKVSNADKDEIAMVFYSLEDSLANCRRHGIVAVASSQLPRRLRQFTIEIVPSELELLNRVVDIVVELDPDIVVGWEVQAASWGYLEARGRRYGVDISDLISRAPAIYSGGSDQWGARQTSAFKITGRHVLNLWRIMRVERNLNNYTFENVTFHILGKRVPRYSLMTLTHWYNNTVPAHTASMIRYFSTRTAMLLELLDASEVITKTAEFARVFGVDFFSVMSRGSQFKVESFMFRIAKPESFVLISPSKADVGKQNAAECTPLIMEPISTFYTSPVVVLDFQSLYPSLMIAYNYCYSTCLGRVKDFNGQNKLGVTNLVQSPGLLTRLQDHIHVAPNGIMFVKQEVRKGLLGRMLVELLETRVMVKQAMKGVHEDKILKRILDARQLSLKYISNVTYGYTSASYSGRMPAVEIADSIVQSGRETLEKAIRLIDSTAKWGAKVVYGDTDSVFVHLRGKTKEQAFLIGHEIADSITALNPAPIKLKFEKVYLPCVLMAKKRYVGFKFEHTDDDDPVFDAKGIETVRRDGIAAQQKMVETCLKILFRSQDLSKIKNYCWRSWTKILQNRVSVMDFIFAKEVRMGTYSDKLPPPPGVAVAARRLLHDENDEPQYGERVPYVIIQGQPKSRLVDRAVTPQELLDNSHLHLDASYYITRVLIPPLERILNLVGADVRYWYDEMPKLATHDLSFSPSKSKDESKHEAEIYDLFNIDEHFHNSECALCGTLLAAFDGICDFCFSQPQETLTGLLCRLQSDERSLVNIQQICSSCTGSAPTEAILCESLDCPWLFERKAAENKVNYLVEMNTWMESNNFDDFNVDALY